MKSKMLAAILTLFPMFAHADIVGIRPPWLWNTTQFYLFTSCTVSTRIFPATVTCTASNSLVDAAAFLTGPSNLQVQMTFNGSAPFTVTVNAAGMIGGTTYHLLSIP